MSEPLGHLAYVNILARDIDGLSLFYAELFGFPEIEGHRSPIYRCLDAGSVELGFNAPEAYQLLHLAGREPNGAAVVRSYVTIEVKAPEDVEQCASRAVALGGRVLKPAYETYYNAVQCVLEDPEGNVLRVNHRRGPREPWQQVAARGEAPFQVP